MNLNSRMEPCTLLIFLAISTTSCDELMTIWIIEFLCTLDTRAVHPAFLLALWLLQDAMVFKWVSIMLYYARRCSLSLIAYRCWLFSLMLYLPMSQCYGCLILGDLYYWPSSTASIVHYVRVINFNHNSDWFDSRNFNDSTSEIIMALTSTMFIMVRYDLLCSCLYPIVWQITFDLNLVSIHDHDNALLF